MLELTNVDMLEIINTDKCILSINDIIKTIDYKIDDIYINKFWNNINNDLWIYIDDSILNLIDFSKEKFFNIIKKNFEILHDYRIINSREFNEYYENVIKMNMKYKKLNFMILSPECFKHTLILLKTIKAKRIKKYYTDLEKIHKFYINYVNRYSEILSKKNMEQFNKIKVNSLIKSYMGKPVVYLAMIDENIIKYGHSNGVNERINTHMKNFNRFDILHINECYNNKIIENRIKSYAKEHNRLISMEINGKNITELIRIDENFTIENIINKVESDCIKQYENNDLINTLQLQNNELILQIEQTKLVSEKEKTKQIELENKINIMKEKTKQFQIKLEIEKNKSVFNKDTKDIEYIKDIKKKFK